MMRWLSVSCLCLLWLPGWLSVTLAQQAPRPNMVVVLADDLGYGDLACYGAEGIQTPHLDRFASQGLRLTDCYSAAANCSPARTGLMTGRTPWRVGIFNAIPMLSPMHLTAGEITVASLLRDAGYATCHVGKWHLNGWFNLPGQPQPSDHGFDDWFSTQNNALPNHRHPYNFVRNGIPVGPLEGYAADLVVDEAVTWLEQGRDLSKPFFLFVCFHEPHEPIATAPEHKKPYVALDDPSQRAHHGNLTQMDAAFGHLMAELETQGLADDTLVFFTSDNGPALTRYHPYGSAGSLRARKGYLHEGGIRVPGILRWPGRIEAGSVSEEPVIGTDLLPTLCELAGVRVPQDRALDGTSLVPMLEGEKLVRRRPLYWHYYRARGEYQIAMRRGPWKLLASLDGPDLGPPTGFDEAIMDAYHEAEPARYALYHLQRDPAERHELSQSEPETFARLREELDAYYREVRDEAPRWPAWQSPRYEAQRIEWPEYKALRKPPPVE